MKEKMNMADKAAESESSEEDDHAKPQSAPAASNVHTQLESGSKVDSGDSTGGSEVKLKVGLPEDKEIHSDSEE